MTMKEQAEDFYNRVLEGEEHSKTIVLEHSDGAELENVRMTVVPKEGIAEAVENMPDELFEAAEDEDIDAEQAEEIARQSGSSAAINEEVVKGFEELCIKSLEHEGLSQKQFEQIIGEFDFNMLFDIGGEVLRFSVENSGDVKGFREQS